MLVWYMSTGVKERKKIGIGHSSNVQNRLSSMAQLQVCRGIHNVSLLSFLSFFFFFGCIKVDERLKKA